MSQVRSPSGIGGYRDVRNDARGTVVVDVRLPPSGAHSWFWDMWTTLVPVRLAREIEGPGRRWSTPGFGTPARVAGW